MADYLANFLAGGTASSDGHYGSNSADKAVDGTSTTLWESNSGLPCYWQYDLGAGVTKTAKRLQIGLRYDSYPSEGPRSFTLKASNTGSFAGEEATLLSVSNDPDWVTGELRSWEFANSTAYRYYRITISATKQGSYAAMSEVRLSEIDTDDTEYQADCLGAGTASGYSDSPNAAKACDNDLGTYWGGGSGFPQWWKYDFGAGNEKKICKLTIQTEATINRVSSVQTFTLVASNTGSFGGEEDTLLTVSQSGGWFLSEKKAWKFSNSTAHRYYRLNIAANWALSYTYLHEVEMMEAEDDAEPPYDDGTPSGGIVFGGEVVEIGINSYTDPAASGGIVFGGAEISDVENHQVDGACAGGIVFGGETSEQWYNPWAVAVKGGTYRISGTLYTLDEGMSYPGLGSIAALVMCGAPPSTAGRFRYDLLSIDDTGAITMTAGTEAATPVMPATPSGELKLDHVLRYNGQAIISQADIGKMWTAPVLTTMVAVVTDDELAWGELTTAINVYFFDQYQVAYTGSKLITAAITTGNGTIAPGSRSGNGASFAFTYTRGGADPGDVSPVLTFSSPTGPFCTAFIRLLDAAGDLMT